MTWYNIIASTDKYLQLLQYDNNWCLSITTIFFDYLNYTYIFYTR